MRRSVFKGCYGGMDGAVEIGGGEGLMSERTDFKIVAENLDIVDKSMGCWRPTRGLEHGLTRFPDCHWSDSSQRPDSEA
jgi:hypothetical protein